MSSQKKSSRLEGKDLITIGIYTVIYVVIVMLVAMLGFIPIFIPLMAVLCPLIGGIPYMLYVTKAKKFGMTAIMGFLIGLIMVFFGNGYLTMVTGLVGGLLADVILKKADYKSAKSTTGIITRMNNVKIDKIVSMAWGRKAQSCCMAAITT